MRRTLFITICFLLLIGITASLFVGCGNSPADGLGSSASEQGTASSYDGASSAVVGTDEKGSNATNGSPDGEDGIDFGFEEDDDSVPTSKVQNSYSSSSKISSSFGSSSKSNKQEEPVYNTSSTSSTSTQSEDGVVSDSTTPSNDFEPEYPEDYEEEHYEEVSSQIPDPNPDPNNWFGKDEGYGPVVRF